MLVGKDAGGWGVPGGVLVRLEKNLPGIPPVFTTAFKFWPDELLRASLPARCPVPGLGCDLVAGCVISWMSVGVVWSKSEVPIPSMIIVATALLLGFPVEFS